MNVLFLHNSMDNNVNKGYIHAVVFLDRPKEFYSIMSWGVAMKLYTHILWLEPQPKQKIIFWPDKKSFNCTCGLFFKFFADIHAFDQVAKEVKDDYQRQVIKVYFDLISQKEVLFNYATLIEHLDREEAFYVVRELAKNGHAPSMLKLGHFYAQGISYPKPNTTFSLLKSIRHWVKNTETKEWAIPPDQKESFKWFKKSVDEKHIPAYTTIALSYYFGHGTPKNYEHAFDYFNRTLKTGSQHDSDIPCYFLGKMYLYGRGTSIQLGAARDKLKKVEKNSVYYPESRYYLGVSWEGKDEKKANRYFRKAKAAGFEIPDETPPLPQTPQMDPPTKLTPEDRYQEAIKTKNGKEEGWQTNSFLLFKKAAKENHRAAQYELSFYYQQGIGTQANHELALQWMEKAAENGHKRAWIRIQFQTTKNRLMERATALFYRNKPKETEQIQENQEAIPTKIAPQIIQKTSETKELQEISSPTPVIAKPKKNSELSKELKYPSHTPKKITKLLEQQADPTIELLEQINFLLESKTEFATAAAKLKYFKTSYQPSTLAKKQVDNAFKDKGAILISFLFDLYLSADINLFKILLPGFLNKLQHLAPNDYYPLINWVKAQLFNGNSFGIVYLALFTHSEFERLKGVTPEKWEQFLIEQAKSHIALRFSLHLESNKEKYKETLLSLQKALTPTAANLPQNENLVLSHTAVQTEDIGDSKNASHTDVPTDNFDLFRDFQNRALRASPWDEKTEYKPFPMEHVLKMHPAATEILNQLNESCGKTTDFEAAYLIGSRVYHPPRDEFEENTLDIDMITTADPKTVMIVVDKMRLESIQFNQIQKNILICTGRIPHLGIKIDIHCNAKFPEDLIGNDCLLRSRYATAEGKVYEFKPTDKRKMKIHGKDSYLIFPHDSKQIIMKDPALLLVYIYLLSFGYQLFPKDKLNFELALKGDDSLEKVVQTNPGRLLTHLARNFVRGRAFINFELLVEHGAWDVLFPHQISITERLPVKKYLERYFEKIDQQYFLIQKKYLNRHQSPFGLDLVNDKIKKLKKHLYDGIIIAELLDVIEKKPEEIAHHLADLIKRLPLVAITRNPPFQLLEEATRLKKLYEKWEMKAKKERHCIAKLFAIRKEISFTAPSTRPPSLTD